MTDTLTDDDFKELEHIEGGGAWCLDGRKERRLVRLNLIEPTGRYGCRITNDGVAALNLRGSAPSLRWPQSAQ